MFFRAFRICDPTYIDNEIIHIRTSFNRLGYPHHFIEKCLSVARKRFYNPDPSKTFTMKNNLTLPYSHDLVRIKCNIDKYNSSLRTHGNNDNSLSISFKYRNTIKHKLINNSNRKNKGEVGVYCVPCLQCKEVYLGETGRNLTKRLGEHRQQCRQGNGYNAIASHSLGLDHRIGFNKAKIIYKCTDTQKRKLVEGALIALNQTFENNKAATNEEHFINYNICNVLNIRNFENIAATLSPAASSLFSQVNGVTHSGTQFTGTYADPPPGPPDPPDTTPSTQTRSLRRSERIRQQNRPIQ